MIEFELNAPKISPDRVLINFVLQGEPHAWERPARNGKYTFDAPGNQIAKKNLRQKFELAYPRFKTIAGRRLGTQMCFQTANRQKDKDNMEKLVNDAFNGIIWQDDAQIKEGYQRVIVWPTKPYLQLVVYLLPGD